MVRCQKPPVERNLTLVCTVDSPEPYTVMWLCDGVNISEADEKYHTFHNQSDHFLVVRAASQRDWGKKYACVVTTDLSQTKRELQCCTYLLCMCNNYGHNYKYYTCVQLTYLLHTSNYVIRVVFIYLIN